jgi:hypothetical protein
VREALALHSIALVNRKRNVTDFLDQKREEITKRLRELKPLVDEFHRLEAAASALAGVGGPAKAVAAKVRRGPGRPRGSATRRGAAATAGAKTRAKAKAKAARKATRTTTRRAGRRKGSGTRAAEALALVKGQPGITIPELAAKMGIKQNYLYRVLPGLEQEKKVVKQGRGWHPRG